MLTQHGPTLPSLNSKTLRRFVLVSIVLCSMQVTARVSADAPALLDSGASVVREVTRQLYTTSLSGKLLQKPLTQPKPTGTNELVDRLSGVINDGVRLAGNARIGTLFLYAEKRDLGGVVFLRFRR